MNRLQAEQQRLYGHEGNKGQVRALLLEVKQPAGWDELSRAWQGVQRDLSLPAPAIAISGGDALQLWFSLAQPVDRARATTFLQHLRGRYLPEVPPDRVRSEAVDPRGPLILPPAQIDTERWSAFVAPDLVTLFAEESWLDRPPGDDAQADLLSRIECVKPEALRLAEEQLARDAMPPPAADPGQRSVGAPPTSDPRAFLLSVMQDPSAPLHLRVEAAKALLR